MMEQPNSKKRFTFDRPGNYRICLQGSMDEAWSEWLGGMRISNSQTDDGPMVTLTGVLRDQAELAGILNTIYEMHLSLVSVEHLGDQ